MTFDFNSDIIRLAIKKHPFVKKECIKLTWYKYITFYCSLSTLGGKEVKTMAKTTASRNGNNKKIVPVKPYKKKDGTKVSGHRRSTPN